MKIFITARSTLVPVWMKCARHVQGAVPCSGLQLHNGQGTCGEQSLYAFLGYLLQQDPTKAISSAISWTHAVPANVFMQ